MPRRIASSTSLSSNYTSPLTTAPGTPTDAEGQPLPVPTTIASHTIGSRLLRSMSRSSRSSASTSPLTSPSLSRARAGSAETNPGPSMPSLLSRIGPLATAVPEPVGAVRRTRRRAYSIHDEIEDSHDAISPSQSSSSLSSDAYVPPASSPPPKRKKAATTSKRKRVVPKRRKLNSSNAVKLENEAGPSSLLSTSLQLKESDVEDIRLPGEDDAPVCEVECDSSSAAATSNAAPSAPPAAISAEPLVEYACPICFSPPTNATLTPCGHVCCGECLFTAVHATLQRGAATNFREPNLPRCPVCRAVLNGWDGRGGGVIGLKPRTIIQIQI